MASSGSSGDAAAAPDAAIPLRARVEGQFFSASVSAKVRYVFDTVVNCSSREAYDMTSGVSHYPADWRILSILATGRPQGAKESMSLR